MDSWPSHTAVCTCKRHIDISDSINWKIFSVSSRCPRYYWARCVVSMHRMHNFPFVTPFTSLALSLSLHFLHHTHRFNSIIQFNNMTQLTSSQQNITQTNALRDSTQSSNLMMNNGNPVHTHIQSYSRQQTAQQHTTVLQQQLTRWKMCMARGASLIHVYFSDFFSAFILCVRFFIILFLIEQKQRKSRSQADLEKQIRQKNIRCVCLIRQPHKCCT